MNQLSFTIMVLQTGRSQMDVATELGASSAGCNRDIQRLEDSQKGIEVDVPWPHLVLIIATL